MSSSTPPGEPGPGRRRPDDDETVPVPVSREIAPEPRAPRRVDRWAAPRPDARPYRNSFIGMAGMAMALFIILASGAVMPWYVIVLLTLVWLLALARAVQWFVTSPTKVLVLPLLVLLLWLGTLMAGVALFGWGG